MDLLSGFRFMLVDSTEGLGEQGPVLDQMMSRSRRNSVTGYLHKLYQGGWWVKGGLGGVIRRETAFSCVRRGEVLLLLRLWSGRVSVLFQTQQQHGLIRAPFMCVVFVHLVTALSGC